jgi:hypothetical protein
MKKTLKYKNRKRKTQKGGSLMRGLKPDSMRSTRSGSVKSTGSGSGSIRSTRGLTMSKAPQFTNTLQSRIKKRKLLNQDYPSLFKHYNSTYNTKRSNHDLYEEGIHIQPIPKNVPKPIVNQFMLRYIQDPSNKFKPVLTHIESKRSGPVGSQIPVFAYTKSDSALTELTRYHPDVLRDINYQIQLDNLIKDYDFNVSRTPNDIEKTLFLDKLESDANKLFANKNKNKPHIYDYGKNGSTETHDYAIVSPNDEPPL